MHHSEDINYTFLVLNQIYQVHTCTLRVQVFKSLYYVIPVYTTFFFFMYEDAPKFSLALAMMGFQLLIVRVWGNSTRAGAGVKILSSSCPCHPKHTCFHITAANYSMTSNHSASSERSVVVVE